MEVFKITTPSHFKHWWSLIIMTILFPFGIYFLMVFKKGYFELNTALLVGVVIYLVYVFPTFVLHLQYYFHNREDVFKYDKLSGQIVYQREGSKSKFKSQDIEKITVFKSRTLAESRIPVLTWDEYNYAVIELKDGKIIKLSSLLVYEFDKVVKFDNIEIKKTLYAWIS